MNLIKICSREGSGGRSWWWEVCIQARDRNHRHNQMEEKHGKKGNCTVLS